MHDRAVVPAAEFAADHRIRGCGKFPYQRDRERTWLGKFRAAAIASQLSDSYLKFSGNGAFDLGDSRVRQRSSLVGL
jgi:hypothetical protein